MNTRAIGKANRGQQAQRGQKHWAAHIRGQGAFANEALRHGSSSKILFERNFIARHLNERMAATLNAQLEPVRQERIILLTTLDAAISSGKATATKALLRKLRYLERRELAIVQSSALP